jgi:hypothetical protein
LFWGPERHGPGNNIFIFTEGPDGNRIEISAELEVVHDRPVKTWPHEERTLNLGGGGGLQGIHCIQRPSALPGCYTRSDTPKLSLPA